MYVYLLTLCIRECDSMIFYECQSHKLSHPTYTVRNLPPLWCTPKVQAYSKWLVTMVRKPPIPLMPCA